MKKVSVQDMYNDVARNNYGFYTLSNPPTDEEREEYYRDKYYQQQNGDYETHYTDDELRFIAAKLEQKLLLIKEQLPHTNGGSFLDVGCGEGFALAFFKKNGFSVLGLDYSDAGIQNHHCDILGDVMIGDLYQSISRLIHDSHTFDIVNMDNLFEHVVDPKLLLDQISLILNENGIVVIKVPNDFSVLQEYFYDNSIISKPYWVAPLDHISYFNKDGLINICKAAGFECVDFLGDQLIEFSALNPNTNYFENKSVGKSCHFARVAQENILHEISPVKTIELYRVLGDMGLGREIIGLFRKHK